jgi:hypothetical protein
MGLQSLSLSLSLSLSIYIYIYIYIILQAEHRGIVVWFTKNTSGLSLLQICQLVFRAHSTDFDLSGLIRPGHKTEEVKNEQNLLPPKARLRGSQRYKSTQLSISNFRFIVNVVCFYSGWFHGVCSLNFNVSERLVCSIFIGEYFKCTHITSTQKMAWT